MPYLNAATQGTRSAINAFKGNRVSGNASKLDKFMGNRAIETSSRILQIAGGFTALLTKAAFSLISSFRDDNDGDTKEMSNVEIYFETLKGVSEYDLRNYYIYFFQMV